jgi:hypothetical protein
VLTFDDSFRGWPMSDLLLFFVAVVGMTFMVVHGKVFDGIRSWLSRWSWLASLLGCYQCSGFWCGFFLGAMMFGIDPARNFACGCAGSFLASIAHLISELIIAQTTSSINDTNY